MILNLYKNLLDIAITEFGTIVESGEIPYSSSDEPWKLRLYVCDDGIVDIYYSQKGKYSYHWNRCLVSNKIYRHDNAPHQKWKNIPTFPKHFHNGSEENVVQSCISDNPELAVREFLRFVSAYILKNHRDKKKEDKTK